MPDDNSSASMPTSTAEGNLDYVEGKAMPDTGTVNLDSGDKEEIKREGGSDDKETLQEEAEPSRKRGRQESLQEADLSKKRLREFELPKKVANLATPQEIAGSIERIKSMICDGSTPADETLKAYQELCVQVANQSNPWPSVPSECYSPPWATWATISLNFYNDKEHSNYELLEIEEGRLSTSPREKSIGTLVTLYFLARTHDGNIQKQFHAQLYVPNVHYGLPIDVESCYPIVEFDANGFLIPPTQCSPRSRDLGIPPLFLVDNRLSGLAIYKKASSSGKASSEDY